MSNKILFVLLFLALVLAACGGAATPASTSTPSPATILLPTPGSIEATSTLASPPGCTAMSPQPTLGPTEQSIFPPVSEKDWVKGPETARVTITEYSDFQ